MAKWKVLMAAGLSLAMMAGAQARQGGATLTALDYYEIQQLYSRFCHGLDSAADNGNMFANVFTADGVYVDAGGRTYQGRQSLAEFARQDPAGVKGPTNVVHYTTNVTITPTASGASGKGYLMIAGQAPAARGGTAPAAPPAGGRAAAPARAVIDGGLYQDDLVKTAEGWRIRRRTLTRTAAAG